MSYSSENNYEKLAEIENDLAEFGNYFDKKYINIDENKVIETELEEKITPFWKKFFKDLKL